MCVHLHESCESCIYANIENYTVYKLIITYNDEFHIPTKNSVNALNYVATKGVCFLNIGLTFSLLKQSQ